MGLQIYGNIDAGSLLTGKVASVNNLSATGIKNLVAGDGLEVELFLTSQSGLVNIQDYSVRLGIGDINARPTGGTFDLGSVTGIAYNVSASTLQANITSATSGSPANTTTQLSPFVFKTVFTANGSQTIPTIDSTGLTPNSTVSIVKLVTGDGSTQEQWLTRIFRNPIAFQDTWANFTKTGVGKGISGILGLGTADIYDQFSETVTSFSTTMEMEITDTSGNVITVFQIPVTIGGEVLGAGITASSISPSNFVTATDVNTTIDTVTRKTATIYLSQSRGSDATGTRNSFTKPFQTFAAAVAVLQDEDILHILDGDFGFEGDTTPVTISNNITFIELEANTRMPAITYTGTQHLRILGLGAYQQIGESTSSASPHSIDMTSVTASLKIANVDVQGKLKLNSGGGVAIRGSLLRAIDVTGSASLTHHFQNTKISNLITITNAPARMTFDNCLIDTIIRNDHSITCTNDTTAPDRMFFKDTIFKTNSSYNAIHKTSTNTSITLDFVGGTTGMSYFSNPSDFTINGNYVCQTTINDLPYQSFLG